ncbi:ABC transporter permease [Cryptosporangium arvum]|uniref:ABC transporter permease n=1 Tax=Cryptosporangium arvum TaxID=80871 RepID=UPI0004B1F303|nr:ABC transporter permease [Cryptosporangium arvum]
MSTPITSARQFRRIAATVATIGVLVQLLLTSYYLGMAHAPKPHHLPVGLIASDAQARELHTELNATGSYRVTRFDTAAELERATRRREVYGGLDVSGATPHLYLATAAGPSAANVLKTTFTAVLQKRTAAVVATLGTPVPLQTVRVLTTPGTVTDVVPLPADDRNGGSLGMLVQALALGGTVASLGLGRLIPRARRSWRRGVGHVTTLVVYALASAAIVLWSMSWFGVGADADHATLYWGFGLVSLAITGSTAGLVALIGPAGAAAGFLYFTIGTVISGASIPPEFLPTWGQHLGQALPTGAGTQYVRDSLYFPDAPLGHPLLVLALYAGLGTLAVLITNALPNRSDRTAELPMPGTLEPVVASK